MLTKVSIVTIFSLLAIRPAAAGDGMWYVGVDMCGVERNVGRCVTGLLANIGLQLSFVERQKIENLRESGDLLGAQDVILKKGEDAARRAGTEPKALPNQQIFVSKEICERAAQAVVEDMRRLVMNVKRAWCEERIPGQPAEK